MTPEQRENAAVLANVLGSSEADGEVLDAEVTCDALGFGRDVLALFAAAWFRAVVEDDTTDWRRDLEAECMLRGGWNPGDGAN